MQISDNWHQPEVCLTYDGVENKPLCPPVQKVTFDGMWGDGSKVYPFPEYTVKHGECYRLRLVGLMSQVQRLNVTIHDHTMTLLAVDGTEVVPQDVSSVVVHAGERYDLKLCATQSRLSNGKEFSITAEAPELCDETYLQRTGQPAPDTCRFEARLKYAGFLAGSKNSTSQQVPGHSAGLDLGSIGGLNLVKPLEAPPLLKPQADEKIALRLGADSSTGKTFLHTSAQSWRQPATPLLMTGGKACAAGVPMVHFQKNAADVEISIHNELPELEVVHFHGLAFQVVSISVHGQTQDLTSAPLLRDTVAIPSQAVVTLRVILDNPGMWMVHAMRTNTFERGAATVFNVRPEDQPEVPSDVPSDGPCAMREISV